MFVSSADLTPGDTSTVTQVFEYDAETQSLARVSTGANPTVSAELWGLASGTTYHYRLVSANSGGTAYGSDETFTTESEDCASNTALCPPQPVEASLAHERLVVKPSTDGIPKQLTNVQKLADALKACKRYKKKRSRSSCEQQARKRYPTAKNKSKKPRRGGKSG